MATINEVREAIYSRFNTQWGTRTAFTFDNERFDSEKQTDPWVRLSVRHVGGGQDTLGPPGGRKYRRKGQVFLQIFTAVDEGLSVADGHAQFAKPIFEGVSFSGVDFMDFRVREVGPDGKWFQTLVEWDFDYDEIR